MICSSKIDFFENSNEFDGQGRVLELVKVRLRV